MLAFPTAGNVEALPLYYRLSTDARYLPSENRIVMERGGRLLTDTFFNVLPCRKFADLTVVKTVSLHLNFSGRAHLTLLSYRLDKEEPEIVQEANVAAEGRGTCSSVVVERIELARLGEILSLRIDALEDNVSFSGGGYYADAMEGEAAMVHVLYSTTVFRREAEFRRNEQVIHSFLDAAPTSAMRLNSWR